ALLEDRAAAHVDALGDVLYEHRAGLLAGTTGDAGPDLVLLDRPTNQFLGNSLPLGGKLFRISLPLAGSHCCQGRGISRVGRVGEGVSSHISLPLAGRVGEGVSGRPEEVLPGVDDDHLWVQWLARQVGGALLLATAALGTG